MFNRSSWLPLVAFLVVAPVQAEDIGEIRSVQFAPNGRLAAFASNRSVKLWDTVSKRKVGELKGHTDDVTALMFAPDGKTLFTASLDKTVRQWDLSTGKEIRTLERATNEFMCLAVSADGKRVAAGGSDHQVHIWDTEGGKQLPLLKGLGGNVYFVAFTPDGKTIVAGGDDSVVRQWSLETGKEIRSFGGMAPGPDTPWCVRAAALTADGKRLITAGVSSPVFLWDMEKKQLLQQYAGHEASVLCLTLSPDGRTVASGGRDATLRLWNLDTGHEEKRIACHAPAVLSVAFSPDGRTLISGGFDCNVNLWETATGKLRLAYKSDASPPAKLPEAPTPEQLEALWKSLESDEATRAYDAVLTLSARPKEAVAFLQTQLKASDTKVDSKQVEKWIKELDDEDFSTRENAQAELQKLGRTVLVPVQAALSKSKSVEMKRRLEDILKALEKNELPTRTLLETRALEVLERVNTPEARKLLKTLASGTPEAELTAEAKAALERLAKQPK